jgi:hypothetical protein
VKGSLQAGAIETFIVSSRDFAVFAVITNGEFNRFTKNAKTGNFVLELEIPQGLDVLKISGSKNQDSIYWGLIEYDVIE